MPRRRPSPAYARRRLAALAVQIATWKATTGDWRVQADKRRRLDTLEAEQIRLERIVNPPRESYWKMPF